ncbi:MAG: DUF58 domain-containing protein [Anaerolineales bacterium]|nr:DUF58 domain-containing protein [Anaerolineales bacterium]
MQIQQNIENLRDIEEQRHADAEEALGELIQQRGDTVNALINHRYVSLAVIAFVVGILSRSPTLVAMTGFLLAVVTFAWLWSRNVLVNVSYQRRIHHTHAFPGETTEVEIIVENRKLLPVTWLQISDGWPGHFAPTRTEIFTEDPGDPTHGQILNAYSLRWNERVRRRYELLAKKRGFYELGPAQLHSGDPYSLFERVATNNSRKDFLVVFPELIPLEELGWPLDDPLGDRRVRKRLFEDPSRVVGIREYQPQDTFRDIHWKATARTGQLHSKVYEPTRGIHVVLAVNIASFEAYWRGVWPEMMEYTLSVGASIAKWTAEHGYSFGLVCNAAFTRADQPIRVPPGRRPAQLRLVLQALAGVQYFVTAEFGRYVLQESPRLPIGATIVMITPFVSDMITSASLRLQSSGRRVVWVVLGKKRPDDVPNILIHHLPIPKDEPDWSDGELVVGMSQEEQERRLNARREFLKQRAEYNAE